MSSWLRVSMSEKRISSVIRVSVPGGSFLSKIQPFLSAFSFAAHAETCLESCEKEGRPHALTQSTYTLGTRELMPHSSS